MEKIENIQDTLLNSYRKEKKIVTIFLTNGFQMKGLIQTFDKFVIVIESTGKQQMIYKHAVSTIVEGETSRSPRPPAREKRT